MERLPGEGPHRPAIAAFAPDGVARERAPPEADRMGLLTDARRSFQPRRHRGQTDELALEHEHRDVAGASALTARRRDDVLNADLSPGEVVSAELDTDPPGVDQVLRELAVRSALHQAVMRGQDQIVVDEGARAGHRRTDHPHDRVFRDCEREPRLEHA